MAEEGSPVPVVNSLCSGTYLLHKKALPRLLPLLCRLVKGIDPEDVYFAHTHLLLSPRGSPEEEETTDSMGSAVSVSKLSQSGYFVVHRVI